MTDALHPETPPIDADDPRLSEWIDGRLGPTEAALIERAVQASSELAAIVADLRMIRRVLRCDSDEFEPMATGTVGMADRVMAAIAGGSDHREHTVAPVAVSVSSRRRPLPWFGLAGALAAGLLVTIVVNRPKEPERDVAMALNTGKPQAEEAAPSEELKLAATREAGARRDQLADDGALDADSAKGLRREGAVRGFASALQGGGGEVGEPRFDTKSKFGVDAPAVADAAGLDEEARSVAPPPASVARDRLENSASTFSDDAAGERANSIGGIWMGGAKGDPVPGSPATPSPVAEAAPSKAEALADAESLRARAAPPAPKVAAAHAAKEQYKSRRAKVELAGVLVIAVSPSERRALDRLVADSGLDVTPDADHLELVGARGKVDEFLGELERLGLVAATPARQSQTAAAGKKHNADDQEVGKQGVEKVTSLVLRVVDRKTKKPAVAPATEAETKP